MLVGLTSCGTATAPVSGAGLNGNWNLVADSQLKHPPLSTTLTVNGNQITGGGFLEIQCQSGTPLIGGYSLAFTGTLAPDGTFHVTEPVADTVQVTIDGTVPVNNSSSWNGTYTINLAAASGCSLNQTETFTAVPFAPVAGTYAGAISGVQLGSGVSASVQISEDIPQTIQSTNGSTRTRYPLSGTISVQGSSCFKQGTTTGSLYLNEIAGNFVTMGFVMDDGSNLTFYGPFTDMSETEINPVMFTVSGGQCANKSGGSDLTKQ
ncbi:hypothetical protein GCM10011507_20500 [Edaphobacter acidisoli]|uniref:Uncharacterized protein n=2 Tax=Edaphobacter acidisoli TaxID=2040573 RepID=A0A916RSZ9_9BACT|nr:hypothetical protein [Edaphobacter acidisoli]GGA68933.1 hypothetical protein GCM10011507_20500 [Edaphobacter acidisoli]